MFLLCTAVSPLCNAATTVTVGMGVNNYMKNLDYMLNFPGIKSNALRMSLQGSTTSLALSALHANGRPFGINSWLKCTHPDKPLLQALPGKGRGRLFRLGSSGSGYHLKPRVDEIEITAGRDRWR